MAHDLVIKNGTLIDGTGADPFRADVVVDDGRITRVVSLPLDSSMRTRTSTPRWAGTRH
jgi:N-acyl-D-aspartate/D-glutamate deacylase